MSETNTQEETGFVTTMSWRELMAVAVVGVASGVITWAVYQLLNRYVTPGLFCGDSTTSVCTAAPSLTDGLSLIVGAIAGLLGLIRLRTFRPLLVVLAALVALGGLTQRVDVMHWYYSLLACAVMFGLAYGLFAWVAKIRSFWVSVIVSAVLVVLTRFVLFR